MKKASSKNSVPRPGFHKSRKLFTLDGQSGSVEQTSPGIFEIRVNGGWAEVRSVGKRFVARRVSPRHERVTQSCARGEKTQWEAAVRQAIEFIREDVDGWATRAQRLENEKRQRQKETQRAATVRQRELASLDW